MPRIDDRRNDELRPLSLERGANPYAEGSCLIRAGGTLVHCTASVEDQAPPWRRGTGKAWVTAEYAMLPRATSERTNRERRGAGGRTQEIQRLIGRSLRAAMATLEFGEFTIRIDCDVLQADGGTRTASITGGCVALADACRWLAAEANIENPFGRLVAGVSVGMVHGQAMLDLAYVEDKDAEVDANIVMVHPDRFVEVQGTGEAGTFARSELTTLLDLAEMGIHQLFAEQERVLAS
ncbi:MAG: ribonuclease PH [Gemmatimonadetes bacterium]|nr:MAG: ribonuclease PH [Gemmatimonadota bacterium]